MKDCTFSLKSIANVGSLNVGNSNALKLGAILVAVGTATGVCAQADGNRDSCEKGRGNSDKSTLGRKSLVEVQPIRCKPGDIDHACKRNGGLKCPDDAIETGVEEINGGPVIIYSPICKAVVVQSSNMK